MIQLSATDNNMVELRDNMLHFKQWLPDECITIEALVESSGENPELYIDEHLKVQMMGRINARM